MIEELTMAQTIVVKDKHRFRVLSCGRRFGKTTLAIVEMVACAVLKKDRRIAYIASTYQQARDICWRDLKKITQPIAINTNESRLEVEVKTQEGGTSLIWLRGWESIETLRGQRFDFLVIDEVAMVKNFWENWHEVLRPTLTDTKGEVLFLSTPKGYNHFYDLFQLPKTDKDYKSFHFTSYDNPFVPSEEIDKARKELPDDRFAQEYLADFRKVYGLVYKEFNRDIHVTDIVPTYRTERILGVDFGYTNPTAVLTIDVDPEWNYWVVEEWYRTGKTNIEVVEYCKSKQGNAVYPDPAEPDRIEEMKRHGLNTREVSKDIEAGIDRVRELFKANRLKIHRSCTNLINELETYSYPERKPDKNEPELPIKENDHACDALRYSLFMNAKSEMRGVAKQWKPSFTK